ncbi:hypothetical protein BJ741DRAFT_621089 [Chytriomyces cf. hyalinus JEL632]|nr:hypothetical protein BJ741DRAFT_621089 [Chytriomyces cf. hyalinus JEL632]
MRLSLLPTEIVQEIFSWTHPEYDLIPCQRLCKTTHHQLSNKQFLRTNFRRYLSDLMHAAALKEDRLIDTHAVAAAAAAAGLKPVAQLLQQMERRLFKWPALYQQCYFETTLEGKSELVLAITGYKNGNIPSNIDCIGPQLQVLNLSNSSLLGEIPASIGFLTGLQVLNLSQNLLEGSIPASIGNLNILTHLNLSRNRLTGYLPESIGNLTSLVSINASDNKLHGPIPKNLFKNCNRLEIIRLEVNLLDGSIPDDLIHLTNLKTLDLRLNHLTGTLPAQAFTHLQSLESLDASFNKLHGPIPAQLGTCCLQLTHLSLSNNALSGEIPAELWDAHQLRSVYLKRNRLHGELSRKIGNCTRLAALSVSENELTGFLPVELGEGCREMCHLQLSGNQFSGRVPKEWLALQQVGYFDLGRNGGLRGCEGACHGSGWQFLEAVKVSNSRFPSFLLGLRRWWGMGFFPWSIMV